MSRREARIARAARKKLDDEAKSTRLKERPAPEKQVRVRVDPGSIFHMQMTWSCDAPDCEGAWAWGSARQWTGEDWSNIIAPKLAAFSGLSWAEIDRLSSDAGHKMHHNMSTEVICDDAQDRLIELEMFEDQIFRFRLGNRRRLWGFRVVAKFEVLWFDPEHRIYAVDPD